MPKARPSTIRDGVASFYSTSVPDWETPTSKEIVKLHGVVSEIVVEPEPSPVPRLIVENTGPRYVRLILFGHPFPCPHCHKGDRIMRALKDSKSWFEFLCDDCRRSFGIRKEEKQLTVESGFRYATGLGERR